MFGTEIFISNSSPNISGNLNPTWENGSADYTTGAFSRLHGTEITKRPMALEREVAIILLTHQVQTPFTMEK